MVKALVSTVRKEASAWGRESCQRRPEGHGGSNGGDPAEVSAWQRGRQRGVDQHDGNAVSVSMTSGRMR